MAALGTAQFSRTTCGLLLATSLFGAVCAAVGPDYVVPTVLMPGAWHSDLAEGVRVGEAELRE